MLFRVFILIFVTTGVAACETKHVAKGDGVDISDGSDSVGGGEY